MRVASDHIDLWMRSVDRDSDLKDRPEVTKLRTQFQEDVKAIVTEYLFQNRETVLKEMERLGIPADMASMPPAQTTEQIDEMKHLQQAAAAVAKL